MVAAAVIGGAALSAGSSLLGGSQAAGASKKAAGDNRLQFLQTRADLDPFATAGRVVVPDLVQLAQSGQFGGGPNYLSQAAGMQPGQMTQAELEQTPGYQFNLAQGLKATQSAAAARGLGVSGASLKGAATYATGLADSTYQNQFNNAQTRFQNSLNLNTAQQGNLTNQFNRLNSVAQLGEGAASQTGQIGASLTNQAGQFLQQGGLAQAAGTAGVGNAVTGGINNFLANQFLQQVVGGGGTEGFAPPPDNALGFAIK
jgi:hypothetical protein